MPTRYVHPHSLVLISGAAEILGGIGLLVQRTRRMAAWGLIAILVIYFAMHISVLMRAERFPSIPFGYSTRGFHFSLCLLPGRGRTREVLSMRNRKAPSKYTATAF